MAASHTVVIDVALPPPEAEAAVYQAFLNAGLSSVSGGWGRMRGSMPMSWASWGERVQAWISHGPYGAVVQLRSECVLPTQIIDWGRNRNNLERLTGALRSLVPVVGSRPV